MSVSLGEHKPVIYRKKKLQLAVMFINYLTIILRKLRKERTYTSINLLGLTVGLCAFLLIMLFVRDELSYDEFHTDKDRMFRVLANDANYGYNDTPVDYVELVAAETPQITAYTRMMRSSREALIESEAKKLYVEGVYVVDRNFFQFFDFPLQNAPRESVFNQGNQAVITPALAGRLFGDENPIGRELVIEKDRRVTVTAVAAALPANSYIQFDIVVSEAGELKNQYEQKGWLRTLLTYVKLNDAAQQGFVKDQFDRLVDKPVYSFFLQDETFELLPLTEQRLTPLYETDYFAKNDIRFIYLFMGIGVVILLLALINYVNLATAQSIRRAKEIGLRKVIGASRKQLIGYQLMESVIMTTLAFTLAFALAERLMPTYNNILNKDIHLDYLSFEFLLGVPLFGLVIGLLAGLYPAFYLSGFRPIKLVNQQTASGGGKKLIRRGLVLIQFAAAGILLLVTLIMQSQLNYLDDKDLGFDKSHLISIPLYKDTVWNRSVLQESLDRLAGVETTSLGNWALGQGTTSYYFSNEHEEGEGADRTRVELVNADGHYAQTLGLEMAVTSESFEVNGLREGEVVISRKLAQRFGWEADPIGQRLYNYRNDFFTVVGMVEDYHSRDFSFEILPTVILPGEKEAVYRHLIVKVAPGANRQVLDESKAIYEPLVQRPFQYFYLEDTAARFYESEQGQMRLFSVFSSLAVFIALIGLVALAMYMTEQRQKEVSIRKVLGASVRQLVALLNREHLWLTVMAFLVAIPVSIYAMQGWLQNFAYRIEIPPLLFVLALVGFMALNVVVTYFYTHRVSRANPADTLRNE